MFNIETTYSLRLFENAKKDESALADALNLYVLHTPPQERTSSNEILYWFSHYNDQFEDRLLLFGFYRNGALIGFAELAWFLEEKIVVLDYMTIQEEYERNNTFFEFLDQLKSFLERNRFEFDFIVTEIPYSSHDAMPDESSRLWIQLLRIHGFGLVHAKYQHPQLGKYNLESATPGALMLFARGGTRSIKKESYILIVDTILFKHYLRWYKPFLGNKISAYESSLRKIRSSIQSSIQGDHVDVNGAARTLPTTPAPRQQPSFRLKDFIFPSFLIIVLNMLVMAMLAYLLKLPMVTIGFMVVISLVTYFSLLAVISKRALQIFDRLLKFARRSYEVKK
ncbi:MAG TPA: hypothetical protein VHC97_10485 [Thermoanaerobaculia bacterium]|jgi:hypothetical protein|nr:hypothetical protein [Thermoanaerobaculia bacterium]